MLHGDLVVRLQNIAEQAEASAGEYSGVLASSKEWITNNFGENGLIAAYVALGALALLIVMKITKFSFSAVKYLVIPSIGLAVLGSFVLPFSFFFLLPITVTACSLLLVFKG